MSSDVRPVVDAVVVRYRRADGGFLKTTLDRVRAANVAGGLPVREFRWYKGRQHYSGWYWCAMLDRLTAIASREPQEISPATDDHHG